MEDTISKQLINSPVSQDQKDTKGSSVKLVLTVIFSVLVTSVLVGAGVYIWQQRVAQTIQTQLEQQITVLKSEQTAVLVTTPIPNIGISSIQPNPPSQDVRTLLEELTKEMWKPGASIETINGFLVGQYGACWGIPEGQCKE